MLASSAIEVQRIADEVKRFLRFDPATEVRLRALGTRIAPRFARIAEDSCDRILEHAEMRAAITGGAAQVTRLVVALRAWMELSFRGPWDAGYLERTARTGRVHVARGVPPHHVVAAMDGIRAHLADAVLDTAADLGEARADLDAVNRLLDLELAVMLHTYHEEAAARLRRSERLSTFGLLVASIGHELRNPLTIMELSLHMARARAPREDEKLLHHLDQVGHQITVSSAIVSGFLDLVRDRPRKPEHVSVRSVVESAADSLRWPAGVHLGTEIPAALPPVEVDARQARHIFTTLLSNAAEAAGDAGEVLVVARDADGDVAIVVSDSGPGVAPEVRARLFEPLITTKAGGTGLGLALCRKLATANKGSVQLVEGPLSGAAFEVRLPKARLTAAQAS